MDQLIAPFLQFRQDAVERLRVKVRRARASQLREHFARPEQMTLERFNRDVWAFESATSLDDQDVKGLLFGQTPDDAAVERFGRALDEGRLQMHGNYCWRAATSIFGPALSVGEEKKLEHVREAFRTLADAHLPPLDKAVRIDDLPGFGPGTATGLTMLAHPAGFAVWNRESQEAMHKLGLDASQLAGFQEAARTLMQRLGADDFLELDWFPYLLNQGQFVPQGAQPAATAAHAVPQPGVRYWAIGLGEGGRLWKQCQRDGVIAIGWDGLKDLTQYASLEDIADAILLRREKKIRPINDSLACYEFCREMKPGDVVFAKKGRGVVLGWGRVESDYQYDPSRPEYHHVRKVRWEGEGPRSIPQDAWLTTKTLTEVTGLGKFLNFALPLLASQQAAPATDQRPRYTITDALASGFFPREQFEQILAALERKKNVVLQGPPGVGKTFVARKLAYVLTGAADPSRVAMVQFHQSYSYEDFVQGYRPDDGGGFARKDGPFLDFCKRAADDEKFNHVFIIDEINRGNLSKIFGELFMLVEADKRGKEYAVPLTYARPGEEPFFVPENVYLLGMMNTADRSLAMVDYALRRRFAFVDLRPTFDVGFKSYLEGKGVPADVISLIVGRMNKLNELIRSQKTHLGSGFEIGHSFFCPQGSEKSLDEEWYRSVVQTEVAPLVREYWFDDPDKADELIKGLEP